MEVAGNQFILYTKEHRFRYHHVPKYSKNRILFNAGLADELIVRCLLYTPVDFTVVDPKGFS